MTTTSPTSRIGLAGLDANMVDRIERGELTQKEAADLLGVKKQAVNKKLKELREQAGATTPAPAPAKALPAPADRAPESQAQPGAAALPASSRIQEADALEAEIEKWAKIGGDAWQGLAIGYATLIGQTNLFLKKSIENGGPGPVAMNGMVRALRESEEGLRRLGLLPAIAGGNQGSDQPVGLVITVLSPDEEDEIRAEIAERAGADLTKETLPSAPPPPVTPGRPVALIDRLPEAKDFEAWIAAMLHMRGAAWLRQIVAALGGQTAHSKDQLASELMRLTCGDPQRLQHLVGEPA
ncbi:hypothetical protein [Paramagnetospirillum magneticum]|uniref:Uncharacterized protein n=1 Tax=Paramagnetospirillum magneticum (strain ATCC 700264 / AMB-1) TaxID=342108 RepID=Q2VYL2_PARM1|nr:hypothetical protein [Paramagnetospirillum magneticum]BAE53313.1 hypothetical protein amb4509 [Paramagnetospirillum magneticum AMB-1]